MRQGNGERVINNSLCLLAERLKGGYDVAIERLSWCKSNFTNRHPWIQK